jgi:hypothetical protein
MSSRQQDPIARHHGEVAAGRTHLAPRKLLDVVATAILGGAWPAARKASIANAPKLFSRGRNVHGLFQQPRKRNLATAGQWIVRSGDGDQGILKKYLDRMLFTVL